MRILFYGSNVGNSGSRARGIRKLGHTLDLFDRDPLDHAPRIVRAIEWRLCNGPMTMKLNRRILERAEEFKPDLVWVEMGRLVFARTLSRLKERHKCFLVNSYSDDFLNPILRSRHYNQGIGIYDYIFTPREVNFPELYRYGAKAVAKFWKGYNEEEHYPEKLTPDEMAQYATDLVFVGHGEESRVEPLAALARVIPNMKVWGDYWQRLHVPSPLQECIQYRGAEGHDYRKALCGAKIAVHFLSRWNRDTQSSRSFEVPACGVFMLAERTDDHLACYEEGKEAEFFSSVDELVDKAKYYLAHDEHRERISQAGHRRCLASGYSNAERIRSMLQQVIGAVAGPATAANAAAFSI